MRSEDIDGWVSRRTKQGVVCFKKAAVPGIVSSNTALKFTISTYKCVQDAEIHEEFELESALLGTLTAGSEIEVLEKCVSDDNGHFRLRYADDWVCLRSPKGEVCLTIVKEDGQRALANPPKKAKVKSKGGQAGRRDGLTPRDKIKTKKTPRSGKKGKGAGKGAVPMPDEPVVAEYTCTKRTVVRAGFEGDSVKVTPEPRVRDCTIRCIVQYTKRALLPAGWCYYGESRDEGV